MEKKTETEETMAAHTLETERLLVRPFQEEDAEAFFACCQNPNLGNNAGWAPHKTIEESREILQNVFIGQENIWAMTLKDTQQLIGSIGIVPDPKRENPQVRMLGYWLDEAHWGKGYMTEAVQAVLNYGFNELQLSLITANCYPHNKRSQPSTRTKRIYLRRCAASGGTDLQREYIRPSVLLSSQYMPAHSTRLRRDSGSLGSIGAPHASFPHGRTYPVLQTVGAQPLFTGGRTIHHPGCQ